MYLFLFVSILSACQERTRIYQMRGNNNTDYYYFDPTTYNASLLMMTNQEYRNDIKLTRPCVGIWCINEKWQCFNTSDAVPINCYHVEHIIPIKNNILELANCNVSVRGNLIMSYGAWNFALQNKFMGEKVEIYGQEVVKSAYRSIYLACYNKTPTAYPAELCVASAPATELFIIVIVFSIVVFIFIFIYIKYHHNQKLEYAYD